MINTDKLSNGFEYIHIQNDSASAKIALQGAHIFHYARKGERDTLWMSEASEFEKANAIRGGVPICWPWFGRHKTDSRLPQHGFARVSMFELFKSEEIDSKTTQLVLKLKHSKETLSLWPHRFELELNITVSETLSMELCTTNMDDEAFEITQALHTYFDISYISNIVIKGLDTFPLASPL